MSKEKLTSLVKYQDQLKSKLEAKELPAKHVNSEATYKAFLSNELRLVTSKIESLKMTVTK